MNLKEEILDTAVRYAEMQADRMGITSGRDVVILALRLAVLSGFVSATRNLAAHDGELTPSLLQHAVVEVAESLGGEISTL